MKNQILPVLAQLHFSVFTFFKSIDFLADILLKYCSFDLRKKVENDARLEFSLLKFPMNNLSILYRFPVFLHFLIFIVQFVKADHLVLGLAANVV